MTTRVTLRAYARSRAERGLPGRDHKAVSKAISTGRIAAAVGADGRIDPALADRLWEELRDRRPRGWRAAVEAQLLDELPARLAPQLAELHDVDAIAAALRAELAAALQRLRG